MNYSIIPDLLPENIAEEEQQLAFDEQLMLDREAYYQDCRY